MRKITAGLLVFLTMASALEAAENLKAGVVDFAKCVTESKYGKQEKEAFEALQKQMVALVEDVQKQIEEVSAKLNDQEFMDALSKDGEAELKNKQAALNDDYMRYQSQYYQLMQQANMQLSQKVLHQINLASDEVAKAHGLNAILNQETCFFYGQKLDMTTPVVAVMDKNFEKEEKASKQATSKNESKE